MHGVQGIVLCSGSVTDCYGEWLCKKRATEAVNSTTPTLSPQRIPLPASTPRTMIAARVRQEVSLENISTTTPSWNRCYFCAHTEKHSKRRLLHNRGADCRGGVVKPVFHHVKRLKCNTTSHGALQTITEGHTPRACVTCTTPPGLNPPSSSHSG